MCVCNILSFPVGADFDFRLECRQYQREPNVTSDGGIRPEDWAAEYVDYSSGFARKLGVASAKRPQAFVTAGDSCNRRQGTAANFAVMRRLGGPPDCRQPRVRHLRRRVCKPKIYPIPNC
jgi:hypothetical protein